MTAFLVAAFAAELLLVVVLVWRCYRRSVASIAAGARIVDAVEAGRDDRARSGRSLLTRTRP